jgi:hypothetical protein
VGVCRAARRGGAARAPEAACRVPIAQRNLHPTAAQHPPTNAAAQDDAPAHAWPACRARAAPFAAARRRGAAARRRAARAAALRAAHSVRVHYGKCETVGPCAAARSLLDREPLRPRAHATRVAAAARARAAGSHARRRAPCCACGRSCEAWHVPSLSEVFLSQERGLHTLSWARLTRTLSREQQRACSARFRQSEAKNSGGLRIGTTLNWVKLELQFRVP